MTRRSILSLAASVGAGLALRRPSLAYQSGPHIVQAKSRVVPSRSPSSLSVRIPAKANSIPEGSRTGFRAGPEQQSERSDAGFLIVQEVFGLVKETGGPEGVRSEAEAGDPG
jgi:hypothetical protein